MMNVNKINFLNHYKTWILKKEGKLQEALRLEMLHYEYWKNKDGIYNKRCISAAMELSIIYKLLDNKKDAIKWGKRNLTLSDSIYSRGNPQVILSLSNLLALYISNDDTSAIRQTYHDIMVRKNNGTQPYSVKNCMPDASLLEVFDIWANYLWKQTINDKENLNKYFDFLKEFEQYYNQHLSIVRSNSTIVQNVSHLRSIYKPAIKHYSSSNPLKALLLAESIKVFITRMNLQSQLINTSTSFNSFESQINQIQADLNEKDDNLLFLKLGNTIESFYHYKDSLRITDPINYNLKYGFNEVKMEDISSIIEPGEALIEYLVIDSLIYIYTYWEYKIKLETIEANKVFKLIKGNNCVENSKKLYDYLIPKNISKANSIVIIPDDKLYSLSFDELIDNNGQYLLQSKTVRYGYSGAVLFLQHQIYNNKRESTTSYFKKGSTNNILSITPGFMESLKSNYIDNQKGEILDSNWLSFIQQPFLLEMAEMFNAIPNSINLLDTMATESTYKSKALDFKIIHFGTHGVLDDNSPLFSKLIFSKDNNEDGYLHTYEIYGQHLNADLAVLSACKTGKSTLSKGESITSLAHAFTYAGCPSTLMTLWNVDEESTTIIIRYFYDYLLKGEKKSTALNKAKKDYIAQALPQMKSPYYWAGIVIMGDDSPLFPKSLLDKYYLLALLLVLFAVFWINRKKVISFLIKL